MSVLTQREQDIDAAVHEAARNVIHYPPRQVEVDAILLNFARIQSERAAAKILSDKAHRLRRAKIDETTAQLRRELDGQRGAKV